MGKRAHVVAAILTLVACLALPLKAIEAGVVLPIDPQPPATNPPVTFSIFQADGTGQFVDVTDTWLPEWTPATGGKAVYVVVNSAETPTDVSLAVGSVTLLDGTILPVPTYPGQCTNIGSPSDLSADFAFDRAGTPLNTPAGSKTGYQLTPRDCGGTAVVQAVVGGIAHTARIPADSNANGVADRWEAFFCPASTHPCPTGTEDADTGPVAGAAVPVGDGYTAFDEYRGFIVGGMQLRTDPRQKDLFIHVVGGQCPTSADPASLLPTYFPDGFSFLANVDTLISALQIHLIGGGEWVANFESYSEQTGIVYKAGSDGPTSDRQMNLNARPPVVVQKGLRLIECLDSSSTSPLGVAGKTNPNGLTNALIYTRRIVNYITGLINGGESRTLKVLAFVNGSWTEQESGPPTNTDLHNRIIARAMAYYIAMETGHSVNLTLVLQGDRKTSYGYHHAPETGSNLDQALVNKVDNKASGFNSFYIPFYYSSGDQSDAEFK